MSTEQSFSKRDYVRTNSFKVNAKISEDGKVWYDVKVPNIAAGGLLVLTSREYKAGDELWFNLEIDPCITYVIPIKIRLKGIVKNDRGLYGNERMYAVVFSEISTGDQIRLDELVHMAISRYGDY